MAAPRRDRSIAILLAAFGVAAFGLAAAITARPAAPVPPQPVALWLNGAPVAIAEPVVARYEGDVLTIRGGTNVGGAGTIGAGNGVLLVLQAAPGERLGRGATPLLVRIASLAVWQEAAFASGTRSADPGTALGGLDLTFDGRLAGSYETELAGKLGAFHARIAFNLPPP